MLVLLNKSDQARTFNLDFTHTALQGITALRPSWNTKEQISVEHNECDVTVRPRKDAVHGNPASS